MTLNTNTRIFSTGMMRTGGSLVMNIISFSKNTHIFNERLNFFRFIDGHFDLSNMNQIQLALEEYRLRLKYRSDFNFDSSVVFENICKRELNSAVFFDEVYKYLIEPLSKPVWGEYANLQWRKIPSFLSMFPEGKIIVVMRDLRAILASFKAITFLPGNLYLNLIFNWIDCVSHLTKYRKLFGDNTIHLVRLEDLHSEPEKYVKALVNFIGEDFENIMLEPERWPTVLDEKYNKVNISAHSEKKVYGFDAARNNAWIDKIDPQVVEVAELIAGDRLIQMGYERIFKTKINENRKETLLSMFNEPLLKSNLLNFQKTGEGTDQTPVDARLPENWSDPKNPFEKFVNSHEFSSFSKELEQIKKKYVD